MRAKQVISLETCLWFAVWYSDLHYAYMEQLPCVMPIHDKVCTC